MARADLHNAFAVDREIFRASLVDASLMDPVLRLEGGLPGTVQPFTVVREYQGPQGMYLESFQITDPTGTLRYESPYRRISLRGEAFEDRFASDVESMEVADSRPHRLTFFIGDHEIDSVPIFFETSGGGDARIATEETFKKALQKGDIVWVSVPAPPPKRRRPSGRKRSPSTHTQPVWFMWDKKAEKVYLINGKGEQDVPGLLEQDTVEIFTRSKDLRSLVARVPAKVSVVPLDDERWDRLGKVALTARLNLPDGDAALERWKRDCALVELTPQFGADDIESEAAAASRATSGAAPAPTAPQATATAAPAREEEPHVEAQVDQEVFDRLIAEGKPERVARAQAKAAYVRAERKRLKEEATAGAGASSGSDA